jgi:hypothetical protein
MFSYLDIFAGPLTAFPANPLTADFAALFVGATATVGTNVLRLPSIREFPAIGSPANIANVPVFGQLQSSQVSGQVDAPAMDFTVNYIATSMLPFEAIKRRRVVFRYMMADRPITPAQSVLVPLPAENTIYYYVGRIESIQVTPSLTDATTAIVSTSSQGDFNGPSTLATIP